MTNDERDELRSCKREVSRHKSELLRILERVEFLSPREGRRLSSIIARLEDWQNTGAGA